MTTDDILQKLGLKYEDLDTPGYKGERETLGNWLDFLSKNPITIEKVRENIASMKRSVEMELTQTGHDSKKDLFLKARLRNYMLLEAFLSSYDEAKLALEGQIGGLVGKG